MPNRRSLKTATTAAKPLPDAARAFVTGKPISASAWLSVRVTPALRARLRLASAQRHVAGVSPWALQDIVAEALDDWCKRNGVA